MTVQVRNIARWQQLAPNKGLTLRGDKLRRIKLHLNCPTRTRVDAIETVAGVDKPTFLAVVEGIETIEFTANRDVDVLFQSEGEVWFWTDDGTVLSYNNPEAVTFTKIASRRARNPELERLMFKTQQNIERRMARMQAEMDARIAAMGADPETGEIADEDGDGLADGDTGTPTGETDGSAEPPTEGTPEDGGAGETIPAG